MKFINFKQECDLNLAKLENLINLKLLLCKILFCDFFGDTFLKFQFDRHPAGNNRLIRYLACFQIKTEDQLDEEEERTQFLQRVLLDYLAVNGHNDQALSYARHFYLAQWYREALADRRRSSGSKNKSAKKKQRGKRKRKDESEDEESSPESDMEDPDDALPDNVDSNSELFRLVEIRRNFLLSKIRPFQETGSGGRMQVMQTYIDYSSAELISRYLASKRPFSQSFDAYLKHVSSPRNPN